MKLLLLYLRRHYKIILMLGAFILVFALVFSLYDLPVEAVLYAGVLCFGLGILLFVLGFALFVRRHRELDSLKGRIRLSLEQLPEPNGLLEEDYQQLLEILHDKAGEIETAAEKRWRDTVDYYTLWAHQIKTPISAMGLILQSGQCSRESELSAELFQIEEYVDMVLSYLRLDSESSDYVFREYSLDDMVRQALRKYARLFILKKLSLDFDETGLTVVTDEKWLLFVIGQLLSNALKYTKAGMISIYAKDGRLCIQDTGIGISQEDLPRVFEKGFTGYNGREDKKSTGIGLYLCRRICDNLGHGLSLASSLGEGTTAIIDLRQSKTLYE